MRTVHKFLIPLTDRFTVFLPVDYKILYLGLDPTGFPCFWAEVETNNHSVEQVFAVVGTGREVPPRYEYVGTWVSPPFVWHLYKDKV